jgi:hypothetical protein
MAKRRQVLVAESLGRVSEVARRHIVRSGLLRRVDRERLLGAGYLEPIIKGWYLLVTPDAAEGESTAWFASYWGFLAYYFGERFGEGYCLGAEASLALHSGSTVAPRQVVVMTARGGRSVVALPHGVSLVMYEDPGNLPDAEDVVFLREEGVRAMSLPLALVRVAPTYFQRNAAEADIALRMVSSGLEVARVLVRGGHAAAGGRLIGAYRALGDERVAREIAQEMQAAGYAVQPVDPFAASFVSPLVERRVASPHAARLHTLWMRMREAVAEAFPPPPGLPRDPDAYMRDVDDNYRNDAYHSLSIEGYRVTPELIEQLRHDVPVDREDRSSLAVNAVKGYDRAFRLVEQCIRQILGGENPGLTAAEYLHAWYRALFSPSVDEGLLQEHDLIGYRRQPVYIKASLHVPPPWSAVPDCMATYLDLLHREPEASVRATLGHFLFVYIHPYADGNGRLARFLMNAMLASGGYPWTIIPLTQRREYMRALETASVDGNIAPFAAFLAGLVRDRGEGRGRE